MLDVILTNPYRVLGVYSNSPKKELVANLSKINAFLKVGKTVSFPTDTPSLLPDIERNNEMVADANSKLALPSDQFRYAQFWFIDVTSFDEIALNNLIAGDIDKALSIWEKKGDASSLQNRIVCNLILDKISEAISCAEKLYTSYKNDFVKAVLGDNPPIDTMDVAYDFLDKLCEELGVNEILQHVSNEDWKCHISGQAVKPLVDGLMNAVSVAQTSEGKDTEERYKAGKKLMRDTKKPLAELMSLLTKSDMQYQMVADKVGLEILQCGIDYYNNTKTYDAPKNAMELMAYALSIVVGQMARERCEENVDRLKEMSQEDMVKGESDKIRDIVNRLNGKDTYQPICYTIPEIRRYLNKCKPNLLVIKEILGEKHRLYIKISSAVVFAVINATIRTVNGAYDSEIKRTVKRATKIMGELESLDMDGNAQSYLLRSHEDLTTLNFKLISTPVIHSKLETILVTILFNIGGIGLLVLLCALCGH